MSTTNSNSQNEDIKIFWAKRFIDHGFITSFAGKIYGMRSHKKTLLVQGVKN